MPIITRYLSNKSKYSLINKSFSIVNRRLLHNTTKLSSPYSFDTQKFVEKLETQGFSRTQANAILYAMQDVIQESITRLTAQMVTKQEQEKNVYTYRVDFAQLKSEIQMMEKNDFALMKAEHDKLMNEIDRLKGKLKEDINRTQSSVRLDINLEKGRLRDESSQQDIKLEEARSKIEGEIGNLKTQMEGIKFQILQYMIGTVTGTSALLLAYMRMFK
ncbi:DUF1640-domain-containing protein [Conidiobolus coronatus NRRL 28638]|uniref:DUF1640-domain-containing protein n=1 Tax=Conidiobolus coronatus (strain ATCC 28846 / CBS 209.66 / NRRL 28638) TaxID=796925 RepID=A0A137P2Y2_CONC2|nr:DUF1640-domain-containing protein [Conidiobolus coronatus NRRL 28638]|eukprot:KXN69289.1 DUF1640-domain-containing protein [Conidiobolus coronatus NRRL 28638]